MDKALHVPGLATRKDVLRDEYVDDATNDADDFNRDGQALVTEYCRGVCWGDDVLSRKQRSRLKLGMLAALGRIHVSELHFTGALRNGCTPQELRKTLTRITVNCGMPAGVESFRIARRVLTQWRRRSSER